MELIHDHFSWLKDQFKIPFFVFVFFFILFPQIQNPDGSAFFSLQYRQIMLAKNISRIQPEMICSTFSLF